MILTTFALWSEPQGTVWTAYPIIIFIIALLLRRTELDGNSKVTDKTIQCGFLFANPMPGILRRENGKPPEFRNDQCTSKNFTVFYISVSMNFRETTDILIGQFSRIHLITSDLIPFNSH